MEVNIQGFEERLYLRCRYRLVIKMPNKATDLFNVRTTIINYMTLLLLARNQKTIRFFRENTANNSITSKKESDDKS